ncbi:MAG: hypothetical protein ACE5MH_01900 [Terriglobia bacterium]
MEFTPALPAPLVFLAFLATGFVVLVAGVAIAVLLLVRKPEPARKLLLGMLAWLGGYGGILLVMSLASDEKVLGPGEQKYFCEVDCHLAYSVVDVARRKTLGLAPDQVTTDGTFYIVTIKVWFDERTISSTRGNFPLWPPPRRVRVVDGQGREFSFSPDGQNALERAEGPVGWFGKPLRPGESYTTKLVFDLPADSQNPRLLLTTRVPLTWAWAIIDHESSLFHKKTSFRLQEQKLTTEAQRTQRKPPSRSRGPAIRGWRPLAQHRLGRSFCQGPTPGEFRGTRFGKGRAGSFRRG